LRIKLVIAIVAIGVVLGASPLLQAQFGFRARDPGPRGGSSGAGDPFGDLNADQLAMFNAGKAEFMDEEEVADGVGPRFNFVSCAGCHAEPEVGGTSPAMNPLFRVTGDLGFSAMKNRFPSFLDPDGPVREVRFKLKSDGTPDGGVHALFVISDHRNASHQPDAGSCAISQENFEQQFQNGNLSFRIPTPVFGTGLIEQILDSTILANLAASSSQKSALGIHGRTNRINVSGTANRSGNDGTISRFGWKAQNKSLLLFSGEAYNVEMGITNELFQNERDETPNCQIAPVPNDVTASVDQLPAVVQFANFQRFLAPPTPAVPPGATPDSVNHGRALFATAGCVYCHTPTLHTSANSHVASLSDKDANLYSDLAVHNMGPGLADGISQGDASGSEFRTSPLWGLGKRIFFLHDGRTTDLLQAIQAHKSAGNSKYPASEANAVVDRFNGFRESDKQDLVNFLRSL
jgi:CxxC motif-containing protein (DUF1111 family)